MPTADDIILWHHIRLTPVVLGQLNETKLIVRNGVSYDKVDIGACAEAGIAVSNIPDYGTEEVADHALALTVALPPRLTCQVI